LMRFTKAGGTGWIVKGVRGGTIAPVHY
jgi:hypothetical protein